MTNLFGAAAFLSAAVIMFLQRSMVLLVIPREIAEEVFDKALKTASIENKMRGDIKKGISLRAAWEKHRVL